MVICFDIRDVNKSAVFVLFRFILHSAPINVLELSW